MSVPLDPDSVPTPWSYCVAGDGTWHGLNETLLRSFPEIKHGQQGIICEMLGRLYERVRLYRAVIDGEKPLFEFARKLRKYEENSGRKFSSNELDTMALYYRDGLRAFGLVDCARLDWDDDGAVIVELEKDMRAVRVPEGQKPFELAADRARANPLKILTQLHRHEQTASRAELLAGTAYHLQIADTIRSILLPTENVAALFGLTGSAGRRTAGGIIGVLIERELIDCTNAKYGQGRSREYRFALDRSDLFTAPK